MNKIIKTTLLVAVIIFLIAILTGVLNVNKKNNPNNNTQETSGDQVAANLECGQGTILEDGECVLGTAGENPLAGTSWVWSETQYSNDDLISPSNSTDFIASFSEDGTFSSTTDCNNTFGSYTLGTDTSLSFGPLAATMMACMEETKEMAYGGMLSEVSSYMITDAGNLVLMLKYDSGSMIFAPHTVVEADAATGAAEEGKATDYNSSRSY